jgi:hypothetical protein
VGGTSVLVGLALAALPAPAPGGPGNVSGDPAATPARQAVAGKVVAPADLQALEPRMLALKPNTARFSLSVTAVAKPRVTGPIGGLNHIFGKASAVRETLLEASGELSVNPPEASAKASFLGLSLNMRLVGTTMYVEEPFIKGIDGGRPWVEKRGATLHDAIGEDLGGGIESDPASGFGGLVRLIGVARGIRELGPATIYGQATQGFRLSIDLLHAGKLSRRERRVLRKVIRPLAAVELFIAQDGLPVRSRVTVRLRHGLGELIGQADIPAIEIPVMVQPPPVAETISEASLNRLLARRRAHRHRLHAQRRASQK